MHGFKITPEQREALNYAMLDDSTRIICYLEELQKQKKSSEKLNLVLVILGVVFSAVAAFASVAALFIK